MQFESHQIFEKLNSDMNKMNLVDKENVASSQHETCDMARLDEKDQDTSTKYGELIVLGYNGCIGVNSFNDPKALNPGYTNNSMSRRKSKYILKSRDKPNGVRPATQHIVQSSQEAEVSSNFI
jgi:hypothetical protein